MQQIIVLFQNRGRFSDTKRPDEIDDSFGSNFIHAGLGIERDRQLFSEAQHLKTDKFKSIQGENRSEFHLTPNSGKDTSRIENKERKTSSIAELDTDDKISLDKKNSYQRSEKELRYTDVHDSSNLSNGNSKYKYA